MLVATADVLNYLGFKMRVEKIHMIWLLLIACSCSGVNEKSGQERMEPITTDTVMEVSDMHEKGAIDTLQLTVEGIDLEAIKARYEGSCTSGVIGTPDSENFGSNAFDNAFVGVFYFTHSGTRMPYIATAKIIREGGEWWDYSDNNEKLVEFCTYSNLLNPFEPTLKIGEPKYEVVKKLGANSTQIGSNLMYSDSLGNAIAILFDNDTIQAIRVGQYESPHEVAPIKLRW